MKERQAQGKSSNIGGALELIEVFGKAASCVPRSKS
jgi:hypothetical protein